MRTTNQPSDEPTTPDAIARAVQAHLDERQAGLASTDRSSPADPARTFTWCGDVFDYLAEGVTERLAACGIHLSSPFPGPFRLWDEDQRPDGEHVRRFWTTALSHGCPVARLCTSFFHRHDATALPRPPRVEAFPPDEPGDGEEAARR